MIPDYLDSFVICGGFPSDSAIPKEKGFILVVKKLIFSSQILRYFLLSSFYITAQ